MKKSALPAPSGFVLVVTLMLMVLLSVLAVGFLSLSSVSLRTNSQTQAQEEAKANARLALMLAIGELQKQLGPDQRITANGAIVSQSDVKNPHWTGVWDSWRAGTGEASQHSTIGGISDEMAPKYDNKLFRKDIDPKNPFRSWLLSLNPNQPLEETENPLAPATVTLNGVLMPGSYDPAQPNPAVELVGKGSLGISADPKDCVSARLLSVRKTPTATVPAGRYGWWVGDESQKARIMDDTYHGQTLTAADKFFRSQAPGSTGTTTIKGLGTMTTAQEARLASLPTLKTLDVVPGVEVVNDGGTFRASQKNFHHATPFSYQVLADVREGGLKRDLSTLLERPINPAEKSNEFMLYKFSTKDAWANIPTLPDTPQEAVPIQDLAAYYQLYDQSRKGGVEHASGSIRSTVPDYSPKNDFVEKFQKQYTSLYRNPIPIKIQFLVSLAAEPISAAEYADVTRNPSLDPTNTHKLRIGILPAITLWNPNNLPMVLEPGVLSQQMRIKPPAIFFRFSKIKGGVPGTPRPMSLLYTVAPGFSGGERKSNNNLLTVHFAKNERIVFEPGESKVFSVAPTDNQLIGHIYTGSYDGSMQTSWADAAIGWNPDGFLAARCTSPPGNPPADTVVSSGTTAIERTWNMAFKASDSIVLAYGAETNTGAEQSTNRLSPIGAGLNIMMIPDIMIRDPSFTPPRALNWTTNLRSYSIMSRFGGTYTPGTTTIPQAFTNELLRKGIPGGSPVANLAPIPGTSIINSSNAGDPYPFLQFALMAGCETSEQANGGAFAGRKFAARPFLHSSPIQYVFFDQTDDASLYNHGWSWWIEDMNSILEALVEESETGSGFYGGGFSAESGANHVVQQELPVVPPLSIAALSHAHLGGFTLANEAPAAQGFTGVIEHESGGANVGNVDNPTPTLGFQRVTATGQAGLFPHTLQAIGNSYAHPNLSAGTAFSTSWKRHYDKDAGERNVTFADHSYLANKALWDEFFFSSIAPQKPSTIPLFGGGDRAAGDVARDFFLQNKPLPNRRIQPYKATLDEARLNTLLASASNYTGGLADEIAAHLMVEGPFNINSTSVDAWKVLFSSLKGRPVAYLDKNGSPQEADTKDTTPVGFGNVPDGSPIASADITSPNTPPEQWKSWRTISEDEIDALAQAMVREVKKRGPFLSLSEFINRRLDPGNTDGMALKGALQAALDYDGVDGKGPEVAINKSFRKNDRKLDSETSPITGFAFPAAATGPIAYGSAAYVDQADILRNFAAQLTPRGDTFVIRTYGDALDASGKVVARAWCEAVVQRLPEYVDGTNEPHLKAADSQLTAANKTYGRKFQIMSFRWLDSTEV